HLVVEDFVSTLPQLVDPLRELTVLEEAAHRGQLEMGVGVYQPREKNGLAKLVVLSRWCTGARANVGDPAVVLDDGSVLDRRLGDGEHPTRVVAHQRGMGTGGRAGDGMLSRRAVVSRRTVSRR